jgi:hypothetical protein
MVPLLKTIQRSLSPFFNFKSSTISEGTVILLREPLIVNAVSVIQVMLSNSTLIFIPPFFHIVLNL